MSSNPHPNHDAEPIAVVATGSIFPGRGDTLGFWRDIVEGKDTFTTVPETHWLTEDYYDSDRSARDRTYGARGAFIPPTSFDPLSFGVPPNALSTTDTAQLLALIAARDVLDEIERDIASPVDKSHASVILGVAATTELVGQMMGRLQRPTWVKGMREAGLDDELVQNIADRISSNFVEWRETTFPGLLGNVVAGRIANRLDFGGSNYVTDAACASSLSALQIALHELHSGDSDLVLTGGVDALNDIFMYMCFSKTPALSPSGDCRPMSADADGTMLGEGVGMLALRRLSDAERDGNRIHAIVKGLGGGSDGRKTAVYAPLASGQERTLTRAYRKAGYSPATVELVEAHGTGTVAGDKTELEALHNVFDPDGDAQSPWCALGSVKSQIGHTKAAAGAAGLLKVIGGLSRKILPPTIKVRQPAKALCQDTPFYLTTQARPWIRGSSHPRRASVSSFGFGGSNFHVTLEEYTGKQPAQPARVMPAELLLLSGPTTDSVCQQIESLTRDVVHEDDLARIASESWESFDNSHNHRAAIVAESPEHLKKLAVKLIALTRQSVDKAIPTDRHIHYRSGAKVSGKLALLFAGQGSQYLGMGADIAMAFPQARAVWDSACDIPATAGLKLHDLAFPSTLFSAESVKAANLRLTDMRHAQPAIAAVALSQLALLRQLGIRADLQAGHSFGEIMALHSASVFDASTALTIACERASAMSRAAASSQGSMLAVQASATTVMNALAGASDGITLANDNAPAQVVLSGDAARLEHAATLLGRHGIHAQTLPVAAAFHSPQVEDAVPAFAQKLAQHSLLEASGAVYANSTATPYPSGKSALIKVLSEQIVKPVLFRQTLESLYSAGATTFLEIGPGSVLTNLVRQCLPEHTVTAIALDNKHGNGTASFLCAVGELAVSGIAVDVASLYEGLPAPQERKKPGKHAVDLLGSNYQKPYPPQGDKGSSLINSDQIVAAACTTVAPGIVSDCTTSQSNETSDVSPITDSQGTANSDISTLAYHARGEDTSTLSTKKTSSVNVNIHQPAAAATSTMAMQNQSSVTSQTEQCSQPQSDASLSTANGILTENPMQQSPASHPARRALISEISARHSQYMEAMSAAHQSYLRLAAGLINDATDATLPMQNENTESIAHGTSMPAADFSSTSPAVVASSSLNGHSHINGASPVPHTEAPNAMPVHESHSAASSTMAVAPAGATNGAMTNGSGNFSDELTAAEPLSTTMLAPVHSGENSIQATPVNGNAINGAAQARVSTELVRKLIAEKTGYPEEMIEDDMDLSGELGIDSIKQVEVLSALRMQVPEIKDVGTADMGTLRTIRQIADFFG
ncbi:MAG: beta-ketoacyl synthase N-terminal-like domain-containing protein [Granulosicoccus sp.]